MSKSVLMSIQPYWGFLIIAKAKGWDIEKYGLYEKTVEVRKSEPKDPDWDKTTELYFSRDKKSLARIPEEYRKEVEALCGKVVAEFNCAKIDRYVPILFKGQDFYQGYMDEEYQSCISHSELCKYAKGKTVYGWHISELKVYDTPKELGEFKGRTLVWRGMNHIHVYEPISRPPQSWQFVEEV